MSGKIASGDYSPTTAKDYVGAARSFIKSLWEKKLIELPRNLNSKQLAIHIPDKAPVLFRKDEIAVYLKTAKPKTKLYLLLMLNCGMYPVDIATLKQTEVDWKRGRINRKRTKTRDSSDNVPKVDYPLWRATFKLLKEFRSDHPELVLVNQDGGPLWVESGSKNDKLNRNSNIHSAYFQLQRKVPEGMRKGLKSLRKTGATTMNNGPHGSFAEHYLGEAPTTVSLKHYTHENGPRFDAAVLWLGKELGIR